MLAALIRFQHWWKSDCFSLTVRVARVHTARGYVSHRFVNVIRSCGPFGSGLTANGLRRAGSRTQREPVRRPLRFVQVGLCVRACVRVIERRRRSARHRQREAPVEREEGERESVRERARVWTRGEREQRPSGAARLRDGRHGKYKYMLARERAASN